MASKLKAKDPKLAEPAHGKFLMSGAPGVGKTWVSLDFPNVYYIDTEGGANLSHYTDKLKKSGGVYFGPEDGSLDPASVLEQIMALATEKHSYKTIVIDSLSKIYNKIIADEAERLGDKDAFGASKKPAVAFVRKLINRTERIDMNVIFIAHTKDQWGPGNVGKVGETFDAWEKLAYELNLWVQIEKRGTSRIAVVRKSRLLGFPEGESIPWNYEEFANRYGRTALESEAKPIVLATVEQIAKIHQLLEVLKITDEEIAKWFTKAKVDAWEEMDEKAASQVIGFLKGKVTTEEEKKENV